LIVGCFIFTTLTTLVTLMLMMLKSFGEQNTAQ
jgi:hypothetical protein